jgi:hypothetical protein
MRQVLKYLHDWFYYGGAATIIIIICGLTITGIILTALLGP